MYSLLIVDDEITIRNGIADQLAETKLFSTIKTCKNGEEALKYATENKPDLIITDIRMPLCDGLKFLQQYSSVPNESRIMILSGYNDFEYARTALRYGAVDYLLKPVKKSELLEKIKIQISGIQKAREQKIINSSKIWSNALLGAPEAIEAVSGLLSDSFEGNGYFVLLAMAKLNNNQELEQASEDLDYVSRLSKTLDAQLQAQSFGQIVTFTKYAIVVSIIVTKETPAAVPDIIKRIYGNISREFVNFEIKIALSEKSHEITDLNRLYKNALYSAFMFLNNHDRITVSGSGQVTYDYLVFYREASILKTALIKSVNSSAVEPITAICRQIVDFIREDRYCITAYLDYICIIISEINLKKKAPSQLSNIVFEQILSRIACCWDYEELADYLVKQINGLIENTSEPSEPKHGYLLNEILKYIDENITQDLSIALICKRFFMNESYFCKLFKSKMSVTFNTYLTNARINLSCELLTSTTMKIYEIAAAVGYKNTKYFSTIFKERTGLSPSEFRNW